MSFEVHEGDLQRLAFVRVGETLLDPFVLAEAVREADGTIVDFRHVYSNTAANLRAPGGIEGHSAREVVPADLLDQVLDTYTRALTAVEAVTARMRYRGDHDAPTWVTLKARGVGGDRVTASWRDATLQADGSERLKQWADIFDRAGWGVAVIADQRLQTVNAAYAAMHGYAVEELEGAPLQSLLAEQALVGFAERHALILRDGSRTFESEHLRKDGTTFPVEVNVAAITDEAGRELYRVVHQQDITERRRTERELVQRQEMFAAAVGSMLDAFAIARVVRDERGRIIDFEYEYVNDAACREHRRPREAIVGRRARDIVPRYADAGIFAQAVSVVETGEPLDVDGAPYEGARADGGVAPRVFDYRLVRLGDGVTITWRDVTERAAAEERFRALLQAAPDAILSVGSDGRVQLANQQAERLFGYEGTELIGQPFELLIHLQARDEHVAVRKDGSRFPVEVSLAPLSSEPGATTTAIVRDITERQHAEQALRDAEERFRTTFERAPAGMALLSAAAADYGRVLQVNETLCEITGLHRDALLNAGLSDLTHPDDRAREAEQLAAVATGEQGSGHLDARLVATDGQTRDVSIRLSAVTEHGSSPYVIKHVLDISERRRFEQQLQYLADHDSLTGLFNRRRFGEEITRHLQLTSRHDPTGAVLLIDLDNFKYVNDTLGHSVGDQLIRGAAQLLRSHLRVSDTVARFGGDEFVVLLPDADAESALTTARHLGGLFEAARPSEQTGLGGQMTVSIGVRAIDAAACQVSWEHLVAEADIALYAAKESGRNQAVMHGDDASGRARMHESLAWSERLRTALQSDGLTLYAQPVVPLQGKGGPPRYELLVRIEDTDGAVHEPSEFLPVAKSFGMMRRLDRQVITKAMQLAAECDESVHLAVNVSAESVTDPDLADFIAAEAAEWKVDPTRLMFEITETDAIANLPQATEFAGRLHALGCALALDDFGAGFGSFYYLKHLPVDVLKIDGGFIRELCTDPADQVMVKAMVQTARGLGKRTVAEWVGDEPTLDRLAEYGIDFAQGYYISCPLRPGDLAGRGLAGVTSERSPRR